MAELVFNMGKTQIITALTVAGTTIEVDNYADFLSVGGTGDFFYAQMVDSLGNYEVVKVDVGASSTSGLSVTRGQGGTAQAWPAGTQIWQCLDYRSINLFPQQGAARQVAFNPNATLTSNYKGEKVYQTDTANWWKSIATGSTEWRLIAGVDYVADVTYDKETGEYSPGSTLAMTCVTAGSSIHYTQDGSTPDLNDAEYSAPITIPDPGPTTIKARGFGAERWESPSENVKSGIYTISQGFTGDTLLLAGNNDWPRLPLVFDDGSGDKLWLVTAGSPSQLLSWDFSAGSWTVADNSWPVGSDSSFARNPINVGGTMYVQGSNGILMQWNGSNLIQVTNSVGATTYYAWALNGKAHVSNDYGANENIERYDAGVVWTTILDAGVPVREGVVYNNKFYWVNSSNMRLYEFDGTSNVEVAPPGLTNNLWFECKEYGGVIYASGKLPQDTGKDGISYWNGVNAWVTLFAVEEPPHNMDGNIGPFAYDSSSDAWYFYSGSNETELYKWKSGEGFTYLGASNSPDPVRRMVQYGSRIFALSEDSDLLELT